MASVMFSTLGMKGKDKVNLPVIFAIFYSSCVIDKLR